MSRRQIPVVLGLIVLMSAAPSDSTSTKPPVSPDAKAAIEMLDRKERDAQKTFEASVAKARDEAVVSLKASLNKALDRKDLDEANRIKSTIDAYKNAAPPSVRKSGGHRESCEALARKLASTKWQYAEGVRGMTGNIFKLNADGSVTKAAANWKWVPIDGRRIVLLYETGGADTLTFNDSLTEYKQTATTGGGEGWGGKLITEK